MMRARSGLADVASAPIVWRAAYWLIVAGTAFGLYRAYGVGLEMRAIAQEQLEQTVADEDHGFCEKFGMRAGTSEYVACCRELSIIRQKQTERDRSAAAGLL
jgi:hypothetical protein